MSERELLELAAKAAEVHAGFINEYGGGKQFCWNPLLDDGDALRLVTKLMLTVEQSPFGVEVRILGGSLSFEGWGNGRPTATRRAIVRAAAEIGKATA